MMADELAAPLLADAGTSEDQQHDLPDDVSPLAQPWRSFTSTPSAHERLVVAADGATLVIASDAAPPARQQFATFCRECGSRALALLLDLIPFLALLSVTLERFEWPPSADVMVFWFVWLAVVPSVLSGLQARKLRVCRELRIDAARWSVRTTCTRGMSDKQRELLQDVSGESSQLLGAKVAAAGFEEGQLRLALELHYIANPPGTLENDVPDPEKDGAFSPTCVTVFLQRYGAATTPTLADLERAAQAVNLHLENAPFSRAVTLENDLFVTPFGTPPRQALAPLPNLADPPASSSAGGPPTLTSVPRATLPWKMAPTLPIIPSNLRISRATPPDGGTNTFVTLRAPPPRGLRLTCVGALVCLLVSIALYCAARASRMPGHSYVYRRLLWISGVVFAVVVLVATFDLVGAPSRDYGENGVELWGDRRWRVEWARRIVVGQPFKWRSVNSSSWGLHLSGSMERLRGAKVLCHSVVDNKAQTCAALVLDSGIEPILAPPGHPPLSLHDQALLVATVNHHLAAHSAAVDGVHNDTHPSALCDIHAGCEETLKDAQARAVDAATRGDAAAAPPPWCHLWTRVFGAAVLRHSQQHTDVTVQLHSAAVPHPARMVLASLLLVLALAAPLAVTIASLEDGPVPEAWRRSMQYTFAGLLCADILAVMATGPAQVSVAIRGGQWSFLRSRLGVPLRWAKGRAEDVEGIEVELQDRGSRGVSPSLVLRKRRGGRLVVDGHTSCLVAHYRMGRKGRMGLEDVSVGMRLQMHVHLAHVLNEALAMETVARRGAV